MRTRMKPPRKSTRRKPPRKTPAGVGQRTTERSQLGLGARIGEMIRQERERRHLAVGAIAQQAHLTPKYVARIEKGEANASTDAIGRLFNALELNPFSGSPRFAPSEVPELLRVHLQGTTELARIVDDWIDRLEGAMQQHDELVRSLVPDADRKQA